MIQMSNLNFDVFNYKNRTAHMFRNTKFTIVYNGEDSFSKEALAYVNILSGQIKKYDTSKNRLSISFIKDMLLRLKLKAKDVIISGSTFTERFENQLDTYKEEDYLKLLHFHPELLKTPIVLTETKAYIINDKTDIFEIQSMT
jgi:arsenate reductase-like glutaredoxin family protein